MKRSKEIYDRKSKDFNQLKKLVEIVDQQLHPRIWEDIICRMTEYANDGCDSENSLECTYDDFIGFGNIEGEEEFTEYERQLLKSHIFFITARDANPMLQFLDSE